MRDGASKLAYKTVRKQAKKEVARNNACEELFENWKPRRGKLIV